MHQAVFVLAILSAAAFCPSLAHAESDDDNEVTPYADIRYRLEVVDQDGFDQDAVASTMRTKVGLKIGAWRGFSAQIEGEAIARLGPEDYNDTVNGRTAFPVVADPTDVLLNQAYVRWRPDAAVEMTAGRQVINFDNQRWIGSVGWRQNDQALDAGRLTVIPTRNVSLDYVLAWRVNRIFGPDSPRGTWRDTNIHGLRAAYTNSTIGTLSAYGYWLDIPSSPASSSKTIGVRVTGDHAVGERLRVLYSAEYARQSDYATNTANFELDYFQLEPGFKAGGLTVKAGIERLEGNGSVGLQTPLATLHAFNGWADKFLATPANGLRDVYADAAYKFGDNSVLNGLTLRVVYHDFSSTRGNLSYGTEWNALAAYPINKRISLLAKFASYDAKDLATDTRKFWMQVHAKI